jgi:GNAT superfamily N-acetyltransferase
MLYENSQQGVLISTARALLDLERVHTLLGETYWCAGISREQVERQTAASSLAFGVYRDAAQDGLPEPGPGPDCANLEQIGFARVVSDLCRFAYLCDVVIEPRWRGRGLGKLLTGAVLSHPELRGIRSWLLMTKDAHGLYSRFGFGPPPEAFEYMELKQPHGSPWV